MSATATLPRQHPTLDFDSADPDFVPKSFEIIDDELVELPPMSFISSLVINEINHRVTNFVKAQRMGVTVGSDASFRCFPHKPSQTRRPDFSLLLCNPELFVAVHGHCTIVPDLVVEVISPNDSATDVWQRIDDFQRVGTRLIWVVDPMARLAAVYRADRTAASIPEDGTLSGEGVLPGFELRLADVLPRQAQPAA
jgi:Uma2 family endonuclease